MQEGVAGASGVTSEVEAQGWDGAVARDWDGRERHWEEEALVWALMGRLPPVGHCGPA
jgi:hypothetical protein